MTDTEGVLVEWEILLTAKVEAFLDGLYDSDPVRDQLVNQAILVLEPIDKGLHAAAACSGGSGGLRLFPQRPRGGWLFSHSDFPGRAVDDDDLAKLEKAMGK